MKNIFILLVVTFALASCGLTTPKYLFAPNTPNVLHTKKKNDLLLGVNYANTNADQSEGSNTQLKSRGIDIQTAFGLTNNITLKCDVFTKKELDESDRSSSDRNYYKLNYKRKGLEVSASYQILVGAKKRSTFSANTGIGIGNNAFEGRYVKEQLANRYYSANHFKWFITPTFNIYCSKNYAIILACRVSVLRYNSINTNDNELKENIYSRLDKQNSVFGDFVFDNQFSFNKLKGIKFRVMSGSNSMLNNLKYFENNGNNRVSKQSQYLYHTGYVAAGTILDIKAIFKK